MAAPFKVPSICAVGGLGSASAALWARSVALRGYRPSQEARGGPGERQHYGDVSQDDERGVHVFFSLKNAPARDVRARAKEGASHAKGGTPGRSNSGAAVAFASHTFRTAR
jgi:hypothetical protein